jgi:hypothetical protein
LYVANPKNTVAAKQLKNKNTYPFFGFLKFSKESFSNGFYISPAPLPDFPRLNQSFLGFQNNRSIQMPTAIFNEFHGIPRVTAATHCN